MSDHNKIKYWILLLKTINFILLLLAICFIALLASAIYNMTNSNNNFILYNKNNTTNTILMSMSIFGTLGSGFAGMYFNSKVNKITQDYIKQQSSLQQNQQSEQSNNSKHKLFMAISIFIGIVAICFLAIFAYNLEAINNHNSANTLFINNKTINSTILGLSSLTLLASNVCYNNQKIKLDILQQNTVQSRFNKSDNAELNKKNYKKSKTQEGKIPTQHSNIIQAIPNSKIIIKRQYSQTLDRDNKNPNQSNTKTKCKTKKHSQDYLQMNNIGNSTRARFENNQCRQQ